MEPISNPEILSGLRPQELAEVLLNAPYDNLVDLERRSRRVYELLSRPQFWLDKLEREFPDLTVEEEELANPRDLYIRAKMGELEKRLLTIEEHDFRDPRLEEIQDRLSVIDTKVKKLNRERGKLEEDRKNILYYYEQSKNSLQIRINRLKEELKAERMIP